MDQGRDAGAVEEEVVGRRNQGACALEVVGDLAQRPLVLAELVRDRPHRGRLEAGLCEARPQLVGERLLVGRQARLEAGPGDDVAPDLDVAALCESREQSGAGLRRHVLGKLTDEGGAGHAGLERLPLVECLERLAQGRHQPLGGLGAEAQPAIESYDRVGVHEP